MRIARVGVLVLACLLGFVILELGVRVALFGSAGLSRERVASVVPIGETGMLQRSPFPEIVWELKPNQKGWLKLWPFQTNRFGMREREIDRPKDPDLFRIAVVGDSYTMGSGVSVEDTYPRILEGLLSEEKREDGRRYQVLNFGVAGYQPRQYAAVVEEKVRFFEPDLVIVGFCAHNDFQLLYEGALDEPWVSPPRRDAFFHSFAIELAALRWAQVQTRDIPASQRLGLRPYEHEEIEELREVFSRLRAFSARSKTPILVAHLAHAPVPVSIVFPLANLAVDADLEFVDTSAAFPDDFDSFTVYALDGHPNARAQTLFAERIAAYLRRHPRLLGES